MTASLQLPSTALENPRVVHKTEKLLRLCACPHFMRRRFDYVGARELLAPCSY